MPACIHTYIFTTCTYVYNIQTDRQPDRQAGRQTERQRGREAETQTDKHVLCVCIYVYI